MQLKEILQQPNTHLIDVREPFEFEEEHIPGAVNIPLNSIPAHVAEIRNLQGPLVLYCHRGNRSGMAVRMLSAQGLTNLHNGGGLHDLKALMN